MPDVAISWYHLYSCIAHQGLYQRIPTGLTALGMTVFFTYIIVFLLCFSLDSFAALW